jgi:CHAD domain-containing protein
MATDVEEIETKYDMPDGARLPGMGDLPGVAGTRRPAQLRLEADYYDTADLRLAKSGITLRRRSGGADDGWHLKLPVGPHTRREIREPLGAAGDGVPAGLASLVRSRTRERQLLPVARLTTIRQPVILLDDRDQSLAEVVTDRVHAELVTDQVRAELDADELHARLDADEVRARPAGNSSATRSWREVEVELTGGDRDLLAAADTVLRQHGLRPAGRAAKLERALGVSPPASPSPHLTGASPAGQVIRDYLRSGTDALLSLDPLVRRNEPDAVHKMRVMTRRLRSVLQAFGPVAGLAADRLADELKWLGGVLGSARDAEVLGGHLQANMDRLPVEQVIGPIRARVQGHFASAGAEARAAVLAALDSQRYFALLDDLEQLVASPVPDAASEAANVALPPAVARAYRRTRRRVRQARAAQPGSNAEVAWHGVRKAAKRARYASDAVSPALGGDAHRFARQMKKVQSVLGEHQDTVVARQAVRQLGISAHLSGENAFTYGVLYQLDAGDGAELRDEAIRAWRHASRPRYGRWLH